LIVVIPALPTARYSDFKDILVIARSAATKRSRAEGLRSVAALDRFAEVRDDEQGRAERASLA